MPLRDFRRLPLRAALACLLAFAAPVLCAQSPGVPPALDAATLDAVVREIREMIATNESRAADFVVREATPARIEALYRNPAQLATLPKNVRENGLIFAGRGTSLLAFERPSDVAAKIGTWFPDELARARATKPLRLWAGDLHLWGPYAHWDAEPAAFVAMWRCVPTSAWLRPGENPFRRALGEDLVMMPLGARQSSEEEFDFGHCVRERVGYQTAWSQDELRANAARRAELARRIVPVLREKFARTLASNRCSGTGPDDCVLLLRMWASLLPDDPQLPGVIRSLEPDVAPDGPLPALRRESVSHAERTFDDGRARFDEGLRRAAFLRAKLVSVLGVPQAWPDAALAQTFAQMSRLRAAFDSGYVRRWYVYELDYRNDPLNPWRVLATPPGAAGKVRDAMLAELERLPATPGCVVEGQWHKHGGPSLQTLHALRGYASGGRSPCAAPDWAWLAGGGDDAALQARAFAIELLDRVPGHDYDALLGGLTVDGDGCFTRAAGLTQWRRTLCAQRVSEPMQVRSRLAHTGLAPTRARSFRRARLAPLPAAAREGRDEASLAAWVEALAPPAAVPAVRERLREIAAVLRAQPVAIVAARGWRQPGTRRSLVELELSAQPRDAAGGDAPAWPLSGERALLFVTPQAAALAGVPRRFAFKYEAGRIARVTDVDRDGAPEVWIRGTEGECDDPKARPGVNCAIPTIHMGEIRDDALTFFSNSKARR